MSHRRNKKEESLFTTAYPLSPKHHPRHRRWHEHWSILDHEHLTPLKENPPRKDQLVSFSCIHRGEYFQPIFGFTIKERVAKLATFSLIKKEKVEGWLHKGWSLIPSKSRSQEREGVRCRGVKKMGRGWGGIYRTSGSGGHCEGGQCHFWPLINSISVGSKRVVLEVSQSKIPKIQVGYTCSHRTVIMPLHAHAKLLPLAATIPFTNCEFTQASNIRLLWM